MAEQAHAPRGENPDERRTDGMPRGKPFAPGNPGSRGRPKGLASAVRETLKRAVAEGEDPAYVLARFYAGVLADPSNKLADRMKAGEWLGERGWGKAPMFALIEDDDPLGTRDEEIDDAVDKFRAEVIRLAPDPDAGPPAEGNGAGGAAQ